MRRYAPFLILGILMVVGYLVFLFSREPIDQSSESSSESPKSNSPSVEVSRKRPRPSPPRPTPFPENITLLPIAISAEALHSPDTSPEEDLSLIHSLIRSHRSAIGENPVGLNDEITAALVGENIKGAASVSKTHPAISRNGELLDRWGTPYRFHAYSGKRIEVSSAGPDTVFFTADDYKLTE